MGDLARDTEVSGRDGTYQAELSPSWNFWSPNGGYVSAVALRAAARETELPRPAAYYCHYLDAAEAGPAEINVTTLRRSKRTHSLRVEMTQRGVVVLEALVWTVGRGGGFDYDSARMPEVPAPDAVASYEELHPDETAPFPFWENLEGRPVTWQGRWQDHPVMHPLWRSWYRFRPTPVFDDPYVDAARALILIDTMFYPAAALAHEGAFPFVAPSMDLAVRFHHDAASAEWLLSSTESPVGVDGLIGGYAAVWTPDARLVATGGQQMIYRPLPSG